MRKKNLLACTLVALCLAGCGDEDANHSSDTTPSPLVTTHTPKSISPAASLDEGSWDDTARDFAVAWGNPAGGKEAWLERLKPLMSEDEFKKMQETNEQDIQNLTYSSMVTARQDYENLQFIVDVHYKEKEDAVLRVGIALAEDGSRYNVQYVGKM